MALPSKSKFKMKETTSFKHKQLKMNRSALLSTIILVMISHSISAQEVTMFQGAWGPKYYQDDVQISRQQFKSLMLQDPETKQLWSRSKTHRIIGLTTGVAAIGWYVSELPKAISGDSQNGSLFGILVLTGAGIGFQLSSKKLKKRAILQYNNNLNLGSINFRPSPDGLGLVLSF